MEVNETRNCLVNDILLNIRKSAELQIINSGGVVKWAYIQKKWSIPLSYCTKYAKKDNEILADYTSHSKIEH